MTTAGSSPGHIDIGGIMNDATEIWSKAFATIWIIALVLYVPLAVVAYFAERSWVISVIYAVAAIAVALYMHGSLSRIVQDVKADGKVDWSVGEILKSISPKLVSLFLLAVVLTILIYVGLILLVVPGVILALMWFVAVPVMVIEDKGVFDSMSRSQELTGHNRWRILGLVILVYIGVVIIFGLGLLIAHLLPLAGAVLVIALAVVVIPWLAVIPPTVYYALAGAHVQDSPPVPVASDEPLSGS